MGPTGASSPLHAPGKRWWGVETDGTLVATALDREHHSWFGGVRVPTCGIGGVTVAPEHRGRGLLDPLMTALAEGARERGAVISTLYATSPGIYRRHGFEVVGSLDTVRVPTRALSVGGERPVRRASEEDTPQIRAAHERWARRRQGPLSHTGPLFTEPPTLRVDGVTVSELDDGTISGYTTWNRGRGYGPDAELDVGTIVADDEDSLRSLLSTLGSFGSVTGTVAITTSGHDTWRHLLRTDHAVVTSSRPYSLAVLDPTALEHLPAPAGISASLPFRSGDHSLRLDVAAGRARVHAHDAPPAHCLTVGGLALTFAGAESSATLREVGHLEGDGADDATWDALFHHGPVQVADYF
ncbi:enhanced intracellular survival protein Eis [Aeromicrobium sp. CTD01-1L150]|uniref:GNAT family N-acetyltransferase n=1 Tax=Aeromicrobium sp. CTD01-1L150 TaxID=3341830 RepID=UPI0035C0E136